MKRSLTLVAVIWLGACGAPTEPEPEVAIEPPPVEPPVPDAPFLPVLASAYTDAPLTSDTLTVIRPLTTHFRPRVDRLRGDWHLRFRECWHPFFGQSRECEPWRSSSNWFGIKPVKGWSDELPSYPLDWVTVPMALDAPISLSSALQDQNRVLFVEDGAVLDPVLSEFRSGRRVNISYSYDREHDFIGAPLIEPVYVRRDRYWEWVTLGQGGDFLVLTGNTEATIITTLTMGTAVTETEAFGRSVTVSGGVSGGGLTASVSATLSEAYSTAVTVTTSRSEDFIRTVRGSVGTTTRFMVWSLTERYTFTDANGEPITHPDYELALDTLYRDGVATALQASEFPSG